MFIILIILAVVTVIEGHPTVTQVNTHRDPVLPARIYGSSPHVKVGDLIEVRCSTFGLTTPEEKVFVYLRKNGVAIDMIESKKVDVHFLGKHATKEDMGNYSCVFSKTKHHLSEVKTEGDNFIFIQVTDTVYPAVIAGNYSRVRSGGDVDFRCTSEDAPDTGVFLAYLCRNQTIVAIGLWNSHRKQASFHLKRIQEVDTGNYSCVVAERVLAATKLDTCGRNSVFLQVYGERTDGVSSSTSSLTIPLSLLPSLFLILLLVLLVWRNGTCMQSRSLQNVNDVASELTTTEQQHVNLINTGHYLHRRSFEANEETGVDTVYAAVADEPEDLGGGEDIVFYDSSEFSDDDMSTQDATYQYIADTEMHLPMKQP